MTEVNLQSLYKQYDGAEDYSVKDFNLEIKDHEFVVFVGPSGCGKSTTLRMIAGLEEITEGDLYIDEDIVNDVAPKDRDIAMVFQNYALYPHMTVYDNMAFGLKLRKMPKDEIKERVEKAAKMLGLTDLLDRKPAALSGGQRQRVALGRAVVRSPKVFLMDEPLSNLDAKLRVHMRTEIAKLHEELEATMIYVTHDQVEAMTMGDRMMILHEGKIQQIGKPIDIYNHPANTFVATFIGSPAMNLAPCVVDHMTKQLVIDETLHIKLDDEQIQQLENRNYTVGIRPEHIRIATDRSLKGNRIEVEVANIEVLGDETIYSFQLSQREWSVKWGGQWQLEIGDTVQVELDYNSLLLFDNETNQLVKRMSEAENHVLRREVVI